MDIRAYNTKDLPYRFVLFCNISAKDLFLYSAGAPIKDGENSLLTYCYIDRQAGLSFEVVCKASLLPDDSIKFGEVSKTTSMKIREGGLISDALVFPEGYEMEQFQEVADRIKNHYGYHIDMVRILEEKRFSNRRHICYPNDIMVYLFGMGIKTEQIWVTEIDEDAYPPQIKNLIGTKLVHTTQNGNETMEFAGAGRLINQPYNLGFGYNEGDIVPIYAIPDGRGQEEPIALARNLVPNN